ncbi:MAG: LuxR family transcriptional regulator [Rhodobacteraceae bacterium]|nr:LuxR family transcriptional regulator [Paracoccaceae bacterium]
MDDYGFDRLIYGFTYNRRDNHLGDRRDMLILSSHPAPYTDHYIGGELFFDAPLTRWALTNHGLRSWSLIDTIRDELTPKQLEIVAFNRKHDVRAGATISFFEISSRRLAGVGLAARTDLSQQDVDEIIAEHGREILAINQVTDLKMKTLPFAAGNGPLTQRQREALECVGDGLTTAETAKRMGLTSATVEKHLRLAREALSVSTTAQAIMKASFQNQIYVVDDATIF